ncbi:Leucine-rich repeat [Sesbania bispinosa]|nr:Leucine-rich repeat [Sesbania bispinosa]
MQCHEDESHALLQFKKGFVISKFASYNPLSYPKIASWNGSTDCCSWDGIECDEQRGNVIGVDLSSSHLFGSMDANTTLFHLPHLQRLNLADNDFNYSQIPSTIAGIFHLPNLRQIDVGYNQDLTGNIPDFHSSPLISLLQLAGTSFYGSIPSSLGNLTHLTYLGLGWNNFSGSIPSSFGNLTQLTFLGLGYNKFKGHLSSCLQNLTKLQTLDVGFNEFTIESETISRICKLSKINVLVLSFLNLNSEIPPCFVNLTQISMLSLSNSNLGGEIPSWIMNLTNLCYLALEENNLKGKIPDSLFQLEILELLSLGNNSLQGELELDKFLNLKKLIYVDLSFNKISLIRGKNPSNATFPQIQVLNLASCNLVEFPKFLGDLNELTSLYMPYNSLTGKIPPLICNFKFLVHLDLSFNNLSGMVPTCLGNFSQSLEILMLQGNKLSGLIPQTYMMKSSLKMIDLSNNNLQGQLPRAMVNCRMLEYLDVSYNQINDSFPFWLGALPELKVIALHHNQLHGPIWCPMTCTFPNFTSLCSLTMSSLKFAFRNNPDLKSMKTSNMSQLQYEHSTWKWIGRCHRRLKGALFAHLSNNMLTGRIPSSLGKLSNLEALDLSLNSLSGKIPQQLTELTFLSFLNVSFNISQVLYHKNKQFATFEGNSFEGNQGLCGNQLLKKCVDHAGPSFDTPSASDGDQDSGSFLEFDWKVSFDWYGGGLVAGVALGSTFSPEILGWLKEKGLFFK